MQELSKIYNAIYAGVNESPLLVQQINSSCTIRKQSYRHSRNIYATSQSSVSMQWFRPYQQIYPHRRSTVMCADEVKLASPTKENSSLPKEPLQLHRRKEVNYVNEKKVIPSNIANLVPPMNSYPNHLNQEPGPKIKETVVTSQGYEHT